MAKGSQFERDICKSLSLWYTRRANDGVFWRTANSGGRATIRARQGKTTGDHCGDICAIDPAGESFLRLVALELKRGYNRSTFADLLDVSPKAKRIPVYAEWIKQVKRSAKAARVPYWLIIHRRDQRQAIVLLPQSLVLDLGGEWYAYAPVLFTCLICNERFHIMKLDDFLKTDPKLFKLLSKRLRRKRRVKNQKGRG